jgi:hypothetical protein
MHLESPPPNPAALTAPPARSPSATEFDSFPPDGVVDEAAYLKVPL